MNLLPREFQRIRDEAMPKYFFVPMFGLRAWDGGRARKALYMALFTGKCMEAVKAKRTNRNGTLGPLTPCPSLLFFLGEWAYHIIKGRMGLGTEGEGKCRNYYYHSCLIFLSIYVCLCISLLLSVCVSVCLPPCLSL